MEGCLWPPGLSIFSNKEEQILPLRSPFAAIQSFFAPFIIHVRVTLPLQTVTSVAELHQSFFFSRPLCEWRWEDGRYKPGSRGEGEKEKSEADDGLTPSFMGLAGVCDFVMNDVRCDAL